MKPNMEIRMRRITGEKAQRVGRTYLLKRLKKVIDKKKDLNERQIWLLEEIKRLSRVGNDKALSDRALESKRKSIAKLKEELTQLNKVLKKH